MISTCAISAAGVGFALSSFQSLIGIIDDFNGVQGNQKPPVWFQSLIGIIDDFNILTPIYLSPPKEFQSLIGIIDDFNLILLTPQDKLIVSIPHRDYR